MMRALVLNNQLSRSSNVEMRDFYEKFLVPLVEKPLEEKPLILDI